MIELKLGAEAGKAVLLLAKGHEVVIPLDHRAGPMLERILQAQLASPASGLGTPASPTQSMIKEWMSYGGRPTRIEPPAKRAPAGSVSIYLDELFG